MKATKHIDCEHCESRNKSIFCDLKGEHLEIINEHKGCNFYKKGQTIFSEGFFPQGLFCINAGKVKVSQAGDNGREQIIRLTKDGDILGYRALLSGEKYSASAVAIEDCSVCLIPKEVFFKVIESESSLSMQIMKLLSHDLGKAEHKITDLAQKPVRERMAEAILFLRETYGTESDGKTLNVSLSREEIANVVGTATETAIRLLSEFKTDAIIELQAKKIKIINYNKLVKTANIHD
jgi:CRP/FNR family transcriptional regulator